MKVTPNIKWFNFWIGWFNDHKKRNFYLNIFFMIGIKLDYGPVNDEYQFPPYYTFYHRGYDFWVGAFFERKAKNLYLNYLPTLGINFARILCRLFGHKITVYCDVEQKHFDEPHDQGHSQDAYCVRCNYLKYGIYIFGQLTSNLKPIDISGNPSLLDKLGKNYDLTLEYFKYGKWVKLSPEEDVNSSEENEQETNCQQNI